MTGSIARAVPGTVASLRVYEPLAAFPAEERAAWAAYAAQGLAPTRTDGPRRERAAALRALAGVAAALPQETGQAYVTELDGVTLVCPWRTRVRAAEDLQAWRGSLHEELADAFVPRPVAVAAAEELQRWQTEHADLRVHVRTSPWSVPVRWFLLVEADERTVRVGDASVRTGRELLYRTAMSRARRRVARALAVLRRTVDDGGSTVAGVEDLGRWLEEFHPRSLVELDYGGLVGLLDDAELLQDESARDVADALAALAEGDGDAAGVAYGRVASRMKALQSVESAN